MTAPSTVKPLHLVLGRSRILAVALFTIHAGAFIIACILAVSVTVRAALAAAVLLHAARAWREHILHAGGAIGELKVRTDATLEVRIGGEWLDAALQTADVVQPWFTVLVLRVGRGTRSVLLLPDNVAADDFRRLRVYLNLGALLPAT
ncbi:MAG TPA: protein YgfX [Gammaproteobacteria bacterium]|nr:protein YgfX [Gammaproteobacteria bacterium]